MKTVPILIASLVLGTVGCTSVKSTLINRTENDIFIGNSNGRPKVTCAARPFNGVPITLRVPTHVDVIIKEKLLLKSSGPNDLSRIHTDKRNLIVQTNVIETAKVFTVDVKRPAAGTLEYDMKFGKEKNSQYFEQLTSRIEDKTIADITAALGAITKGATTGAKPPDPQEDQTTKAHIIPEVRTVAWRRFDIDSLDFEDQVASFVAQHLNNCNSCQCYQAWSSSASPSHVELAPRPDTHQ